MIIKYRKAIENDFEKIHSIWSKGIKSTFAHLLEPKDAKDKFYKIFKGRKKYEFWVALLNEEVIGFQSYLPISKNPLKSKYMVESSTYIDSEFINQGIGYNLLVFTLSELKKKNIQSVIAFISIDSYTTIKIAEKLDFMQIGNIPKIGKNKEKLIFLKLINSASSAIE